MAKKYEPRIVLAAQHLLGLTKGDHDVIGRPAVNGIREFTVDGKRVSVSDAEFRQIIADCTDANYRCNCQDWAETERGIPPCPEVDSHMNSCSYKKFKEHASQVVQAA